MLSECPSSSDSTEKESTGALRACAGLISPCLVKSHQARCSSHFTAPQVTPLTLGISQIGRCLLTKEKSSLAKCTSMHAPWPLMKPLMGVTWWSRKTRTFGVREAKI